MLSQAWVSLIHLLHNTKKVKKLSDGMEPERTEAELSHTNGEQQQEDVHHYGPG
jgi:hypothetical protein